MFQRQHPSHALFIGEIFREVLEYIPAASFREKHATLEHVPPLDTEASRTLARIARMCKAFSEPALDVLWRDLYDIEHLLKLLSAFKLKSGKREKQYFCLNGDISEQEWARFTTYAKRVQRFEYSRRVFEVAVFERLAQLCKESPLLPSLRELRWRMNLPYLAPAILLFIAPGLRLLTFHGNWRGLSVAYPLDRGAKSQRSELPLTMIRMLADRATRLEVLTGDRFELPPDGGAWEAFRRFHKLNTLACYGQPNMSDPPSVRPSFRALAAIPHLRSLDIVLSDYDLVAQSDSLVFESLEALKLHLACNPPWMTRFFSAVVAPRLSSLSVVSHIPRGEDGNPPILQTSVQMLAGSLAGSLQEVDLDYQGMNPADRGFMLQLLVPLLQLPQLTSVSLRLRLGIYVQTFTDDDVSSLASAWPQLRALSISVFGLERSGSELPSLDCLEAFAEFCGNLRSLALPITPTLPVYKHGVFTASRGHPLEKLSLQLLRLAPDNDREFSDFVPAPGEVESMARSVYQLFPSLNLAMCLLPLCGGRGWYRDPAPWDSVVEAMAMLQDSGGKKISAPFWRD